MRKVYLVYLREICVFLSLLDPDEINLLIWRIHTEAVRYPLSNTMNLTIGENTFNSCRNRFFILEMLSQWFANPLSEIWSVLKICAPPPSFPLRNLAWERPSTNPIAKAQYTKDKKSHLHCSVLSNLILQYPDLSDLISDIRVCGSMAINGTWNSKVDLVSYLLDRRVWSLFRWCWSDFRFSDRRNSVSHKTPRIIRWTSCWLLFKLERGRLFRSTFSIVMKCFLFYPIRKSNDIEIEYSDRHGRRR